MKPTIAALVVLCAVLVTPASADQPFVRGDVDSSGFVDLSDAIRILGCLFSGGECPTCDDAADADDSGIVDISDALKIIGFLYLGEEPLPPPATCGPDPTPDGLTCAEYSRCEAVEPVKLFWPLPGVDGQDWVITSYVDLDPGPGLKDYTGATGAHARVLDQNIGVDIDIANFRAMDAIFPVLAAAPGKVVEIREDQSDRNTSREQPCGSFANFVVIEHADGTTAHYRNLKKDSVVVSVGDEVAAGDKIAAVGSSGCSAQPHLHFELHNSAGKFLDPFSGGKWVQPPAYDAPVSIMDVALKAGEFENIDQVKDPPATDAESIAPETTLGIGLSIARGLASQSILVELRNPSGLLLPLGVFVPDTVRQHSFRSFNIELRETGQWTLNVRVNGAIRHQSKFGVHYPNGYQTFGLELTAASLKESLEDEEFRPVAVDGYNVGRATRYNVVRERSPGVRWTLLYDIPADLIRPLINLNTQTGLRVVDIDSYLVDRQLHFLALMTDEPGPEQELILGLPEPMFSTMLDMLKGRGLLPIDMSVVDMGPLSYGTALCEKRTDGDLLHLSGLSDTQYQSAFDQQIDKGLRLISLDVRNDAAGIPRFTAIWGTKNTGGWAVRHHMDKAGLTENIVEFTFRQHLKTRLITGYVLNGAPAFGASWSQR